MQTSELLQQLLAGQRALALQLAELQEEQQVLARRLLAREDRRELARLLPMAHALMGSSAWTAVSLFEGAVAQSDESLCALLRDWTTDTGGLRSFGRFLERVSACACGGLRLDVVRGGRDRDGAVYVVKRVSLASKLARQVAPQSGITDSQPVHHRTRKPHA